jgi:hypothetical protein
MESMTKTNDDRYKRDNDIHDSLLLVRFKS